MAIGDAFTQNELSPYEWALFAERCGLPKAFVARELRELASKVKACGQTVAAEAIDLGARQAIVNGILEGALSCCAQMLEIAPKIAQVKTD